MLFRLKQNTNCLIFYYCLVGLFQTIFFLVLMTNNKIISINLNAIPLFFKCLSEKNKKNGLKRMFLTKFRLNKTNKIMNTKQTLNKMGGV